MNTETATKITFDRKEAAQKLGVSVVTVDREIARKRIPHFRVGRRVLFTDSHLQEYIESNTSLVRTKGKSKS